MGSYLHGSQAQAWFEQGAWEDAAEEATQLLRQDHLSPILKKSALLVLGRVRLRRGDPGSAPLLEESYHLALATGEYAQIVEIAPARAEAAWLAGDLERCQAEARAGYDLALGHADPWMLGDLSSWLWRAGCQPHPQKPIAEPYARQLAGDWQGAATLWEVLGCPYEQALVLAEGDEAAQRQAIALLEQLGAQPAMALVRQRMRQQRRSIPRGPRPATQANGAGLTSRQGEVLQLLAEGLTNAEIASRLTISLKTVDRHLAAIFAKLEVHSRTRAVKAASTLGLLSHPTEEEAAPSVWSALVPCEVPTVPGRQPLDQR
jgi:ATP/maltotriose-dependent transcriptional regulator MalT